MGHVQSTNLHAQSRLAEYVTRARQTGATAQPELQAQRRDWSGPLARTTCGRVSLSSTMPPCACSRRHPQARTWRPYARRAARACAGCEWLFSFDMMGRGVTDVPGQTRRLRSIRHASIPHRERPFAGADSRTIPGISDRREQTKPSFLVPLFRGVKSNVAGANGSFNVHPCLLIHCSVFVEGRTRVACGIRTIYLDMALYPT